MLYESLKATTCETFTGKRCFVYPTESVDSAVQELVSLLTEKDSRIAELEAMVRKVISDSTQKQADSINLEKALSDRVKSLMEECRAATFRAEQAEARSKDLALRVVDLQDKLVGNTENS